MTDVTEIPLTEMSAEQIRARINEQVDRKVSEYLAMLTPENVLTLAKMALEVERVAAAQGRWREDWKRSDYAGTAFKPGHGFSVHSGQVYQIWDDERLKP